MAALARSYQKFLRVAPQAPGLARQMSGGHGGGYAVWKKGFFFAAIPIMILGHVNAFGMADESAHQAPEFVPYDHLRIRSKAFPWGDGNHSLIHNSHVNALPDGYEKFPWGDGNHSLIHNPHLNALPDGYEEQ